MARAPFRAAYINTIRSVRPGWDAPSGGETGRLFPFGSAVRQTLSLSQAQEVANFGARPSTAEKETLHLCAACCSEPLDLRPSFSALCSCGYAELGSKADNRANEGNVIGSFREAIYKGPVDLDLVEGKAA